MSPKGRLRDSRQLTHDDSRRLIVVALMPPQTALDPPAVFALVVEEGAAPAAHVVFEFYLRVLLHTYLDCDRPGLVPWKTGFFMVFLGQNRAKRRSYST